MRSVEVRAAAMQSITSSAWLRHKRLPYISLIFLSQECVEVSVIVWRLSAIFLAARAVPLSDARSLPYLLSFLANGCSSQDISSFEHYVNLLFPSHSPQQQQSYSPGSTASHCTMTVRSLCRYRIFRRLEVLLLSRLGGHTRLQGWASGARVR